ncbi:hypothetical protein ABI59_12660 [Acidobacteria bacterium Mor1]|nr:hypothetical protein ABI59_12660 [Acidobacteria bacterium Mor1]
MKHICRLSLLCAVALLLCGTAAAQDSYDNRSLERLGSGSKTGTKVYTNADLARLKPLPVQGSALADVDIDVSAWIAESHARGSERRTLEYWRDRLQAELDYEMARIDAAYSVGGGDFTGSQRQGLKSKLEGRLNRLHREIYLVDWQIARLEGRDLPAPDLRR